jgi:hypothetical protein
LRLVAAAAALAVGLALAASQPAAQRAHPRDGRDAADFAAFVKAATTRAEYSSPLVDHLPLKAGVPTPKEVLDITSARRRS